MGPSKEREKGKEKEFSQVTQLIYRSVFLFKSYKVFQCISVHKLFNWFLFGERLGCLF